MRSVAKLEADMRSLEHLGAQFGKVVDQLQQIKAIKWLLLTFATVLIGSAIALGATAVRQDQRMNHMQEELAGLRVRGEMSAKGIDQVALEIRAMSTEMHTWIAAQREMEELAKRNLEKKKRRR